MQLNFEKSLHDREISSQSRLRREGYTPGVLSAFQSHTTRRKCFVLLLHKVDLETYPCLDKGSAPCHLPKSIFSFLSVIAAKCGWAMFLAGITSRGVLFSSGSLAAQLSALGMPIWSFPRWCSSKETQNPAASLSLLPGTPPMAVGEMLARARPAKGWTEGCHLNQWCKVGAGQQVSSESCLELLVTQVGVLTVAGRSSWNSPWITPINKCLWDSRRQFSGGNSWWPHTETPCAIGALLKKNTKDKLSSLALCLPTSSPQGVQGKPWEA